MIETIVMPFGRGLRAEANSPEPHPKIVRTIEKINQQYKRLDIDYCLKLIDLHSHLRTCTTEKLESILEISGLRDELIERIQTPLSFEEQRANKGIINRNGKWYKIETDCSDEIELKKIQYNGFVDENQWKLSRNFDHKSDRIKNLSEEYERFEGLLKSYKLNPDHYIYPPNSTRVNKAKRFVNKSFEDFVKYCVENDSNSDLEKSLELLGAKKPFPQDIELLEKDYDGEIHSAYLNGSKVLANTSNFPELNILDLCALYINNINNIEGRKKEVSRFFHIIDNEFLKESTYIFHRIAPSLGYEKWHGGFRDGLSKHLNEKFGKHHILIDTLRPSFSIDTGSPQVYFIMRDTYGTGGYSSIIDIDNITEDRLRMLVTHELAHLISEAIDISDYNTEGDPRLMLSPVYHEKLSDKSAQLKISDKSVREAYVKLFE